MQTIPLSELVHQITEAIDGSFGYDVFWIRAEITDVKKYESKNWCFLKFIEKKSSAIDTEIKGVFWNSTYHVIQKFEKATKQNFTDGLQINCAVRVRFHKRYGLSLEVQDIDISHTIGQMELERQATLDALIKNFPTQINCIDGDWLTVNNQLPIAIVPQNIALITAPNSDGLRDFTNELLQNNYGYHFYVHEFVTTVQGDHAHINIQEQLDKILESTINFNVVVIVRGGGSQTDFKSFDQYSLASKIALYPIAILTGIGHDRNTSIADLMARQFKTPTKVANYLVECLANFERELLYFQENIQLSFKNKLENEKHFLKLAAKSIQLLHPNNILQKGFALLKQNGKIITDAKELDINIKTETIMKDKIITSTINKIS